MTAKLRGFKLKLILFLIGITFIVGLSKAADKETSTLITEKLGLSFGMIQFRKVSGTVTDEAGESLEGVVVTVKGHNNLSAITDENGNFNLDLPTDDEILIFNYLGFEKKEVSTQGRMELTIVLKKEISNLDEVVVVGYGTVKKRDLTGAVSSVSAEEIKRTPTSNVMDALQGKVSGMDILKSSGRAGAGVDISLRGNRSIYGDNAPLFIIDGLPGDYSKLNPSDIESIDVLKDASSTAIYGSAGSNGVVIITTKNGKKGRLSVNFDAYFGYNGFPKYPHGLTGDAYVKLKREAYRGEHGDYPEFMNDIFQNPNQLAAFKAGKWVDWVDLVLRDGIQQNYSLSLSSQTKKTATYLSLDYNDEQGLINNDDFKKYSLRANISHNFSNKIKVGTHLQMTYSNNNRAAQNIFGNALTFLPLGDPFDDDGHINHVPVDGVTNPLSDQIKDQYRNNVLDLYFSGNAYFKYQLIEGLSFKSIFGATLESARTGKYFGKESIANPEAGFNIPAAVISNNRTYNYRWENILEYDFDINTDHHFALTGVTAWSKNQSESSYSGGSGFDLDSYLFYNLNAATSSLTIKSNYIGSQTMSFVGRANYNYRGKYFVSLSNRWDGVSHLSKGHKWDIFPAGAVAWRISDEEFFKNVNSVTNLKLRLSYGVTGNSGGVGAYGTLAGGFNAAKPVGFGENPAPAFILNQQLANAGLGWEKSYTANIGLDLELWKGVLAATVDLYNTDTKDLLYLRKMPGSLGGSWGAPFSMWQNVGETNNKGIEVRINSYNINQEDFTWKTTFTFARNKEEITSLPGNEDLISSGLFLNHPIQTFYGYKYKGIWQENEAAEAEKFHSQPGDIKLETDGTFKEDGTHAYGSDDRQILGSGVPDWTGGIQNTFTYKNFDVNIFLTARWGQMIENELITRYDPTTGVGNSPDDIDYWTPENPNAYLPRPGLHATRGGYIGFGSLRFVNGSYFKIRNITIGYNLPKQLIDKLSLQKCRIYATANNPFIFTKSKLLKYQDPESNGRDNFPLTKQFVFGLNVEF